MAYLDAFYSSLLSILPFSSAGPQAFLMLALGVLIGFVVGILPGLGGSATLAILLPFVFGMEPLMAFALLLGTHSVLATTGDITSVLLGIPGEGVSAATVIDGHAMAVNGEAGRALGAVLMSSLIGTITGALVLALSIPLVRPIVLSLGTPEQFMLVLLGISYIALLSGENLIRGLTAGALGLLLSTVGLDPIDSIPRYTLESVLGNTLSLYLWDGINLIPVTIGLFAIPEIVNMLTRGSLVPERKQETSLRKGILTGIRDTFEHWWLVIRCSAIGTYIGIIPGLGGSTAQWIAYAHAAQSSHNKDRFGKGAIEGVLGPGAANNSKEGGALLPTIAFGVPGSVAMAVLLGAFVILGLVPGPDMLDPDKHLHLTFSFVWIIVIANILAVLIALLSLNYLLKVITIKSALLFPLLMGFLVIGAYSVRNSLADLVILLIFGLLGWLMVRFEWQRPPLLLGLVLGGMAENNLFISMNLYGFNWLTRPGVIVIGVLIIFALVYPLISKARLSFK